VQEYYAPLGDKEQLRFVLGMRMRLIPVLDEEWFEDDIVAQFRRFVRVVWARRTCNAIWSIWSVCWASHYAIISTEFL